MLRQGDITVRQETIEDALLATELLRADPRIDKDRVFLLGHSMGAMLAPRIDAEGGNYRGLILMAGTLRNLEDILLAQNEEVIDELPRFLRPLMIKQVAKLKKTFEGLYQRSDEDAKSIKIGGGTTLYYFKEMGLHPAKDYLETFTRPLLILQGGKDFQVKADVDYAQYRALLEGRDNVTFRLYPELNHCFVPAIYTQISKAKQEYRPERHMSRDVTGDIARFILNN
jgi:pimeloyl-ACP methyl ester carboxylesterase